MARAGAFAALELEIGDSRLTLVPEAGGAIAAWRVSGQPMMHESRTVAAPGWNPLEMASFPLVPYSNRIAGGRFPWIGVVHHLPPNRPGFRHPLHGIGWQAAWQVVERGTDFAVLRHEFDGGADWPWAYAVEQHFVLSDAGLTVGLAVTNLSDTAAPLAVGLHPYFDADGARLTFVAKEMWREDSEQLPTEAEPVEGTTNFATGRRVADVVLDNCFDGWDGIATIRWDDRPLQLRIAADLPCAVVYTPSDAGFFCFEPVAHTNNALNLSGAGQPMPVVMAGERVIKRVEFAVEECG